MLQKLKTYTFPLIAIGVLFYLLYDKNNTVEELKIDFRNSKENCFNLDQAYQAYIKKKLQYDNIKIDSSINFVDLNKNQINVRSLFKTGNSYKYFLFFDGDACSDCIAQEFNFIKTHFSASSYHIITAFDTYKEFYLYSESHDLPKNTLNVSKDYLELFGFDTEGVVGFILSQDLEISHIHFASSAFKNLSQDYYATIPAKYKINKE